MAHSRAGRLRIALLGVLAIGALASAPALADAPPWTGLVANNESPFDNVGTFDPVAPSFTQNIGVGGDNVWVGPSPDGTRAYALVVYPSPALHVIDLTTDSDVEHATLPNGNLFFGAVSPDGTHAYLAGGGQVVPVDLTKDPPVVGDTIAVQNAALIALSPDGKTAWVTAGTGGATTTGVIPVDVATGTPGTLIPTGTNAVGVAVSPDGSTVWVANHDSQTVSVIDAATDSVTKTIDVTAGHPNYVAVAPDGRHVWVSLQSEHKVLSIDTSDFSVSDAVDTGGVEARGLAFTPDGKTLFVTDGAFNGTGQGSQVTPVDLTADPPSAGTAITGFDDPVWDSVTPDQAPVADFTVSSGSPGTATSFDASSSLAPSTPITSYAWDFGDGSTQTTTSPTVSHVYAAGGTYDVTLTETDAAGTSTARVYTGQQVVRNGGSSATARKTVVIAAGGAPAVRLSSTAIDFGTRAPGHEGAASPVTVSNTGSAPLAVSSVHLGGPDPGDFLVHDDGCSGASVAPGAGCSLSVTFKPARSGLRTATLQVNDNASGSPHVALLRGVGNPNGNLSGTVLDGSHSDTPPVAGAHVSVCTFSTRAICRSDTTDAHGRFSVSNLPQASYQVEVLPGSGSLFPASQVVDVGAGTTVSRTFYLHRPEGLPSGWVFNGSTGSGPPTSFWTSPVDLQVPLRVLPHLPPGSFAGTVITYYAAPDTPGYGTASLGSLTVVYWYDQSGTPRFVEDIPRNYLAGWIGSSDGVLGKWSLNLRDAPTAGETDMTNAMVDGVLTPPAKGPFFHGGASYQVSQVTFGFFPPAGATAGRLAHAARNSSLPAVPGAPGGPSRTFAPTSPSCPIAPTGTPRQTPQRVYSDHKLEDPLRNGSRVDRSDPHQPWFVKPNGEQFPQDPNWGYRDPARPGSQPVSIFANPDGSGFTVDENGDTHPVPKPNPGDPNSPVVPLHPDQGPVPVQRGDGSASNGYGLPATPANIDSGTTIMPVTPTTELDSGTDYDVHPWQDAPGASSVHARVLTGSARRVLAHLACEGEGEDDDGDSGGFDDYHDPSGRVVTAHGVPVAGARVLLLRSPSRRGRLRKVPNRSRIMSPANRRNPDRTDIDGHFGWDVITGFYRVQASHAGCTARAGSRRQASTRLLKVPPPVDDLRLVLRCPHLRRAATRTRLRLKAVPVGQTALVAHVRPRHGRRVLGGIVSFRRGRRVLAVAPLVRRDGLVVVTVRRIARHARVVAVYGGNGRYAPSRGRARA